MRERSRAAVCSLLAPEGEAAIFPLMTRSSPDVLIIGAGAIGASVAHHLSLAGVRVTVLEK